ncbi:hypothetical protein [Luedemannella flava]|uniref:hypothetical protein n=1 Tax=Luedemannella flava TaxID=349316 RepID=UPI0031D77817
MGSSAVRNLSQWASAPSAVGAVAPAAAALGVVSASGYGARTAPTFTQQHQGTLVEISKINLDEQASNISTTSKGNTSAMGAGMAKSLRRSGGVPPRGRPV